MNNLKYKFNGSDELTNHYAQIGQDIFVLTALNGKLNGTYLEIGGGPAITNNNTYLLESKYNWKGVSLDINKEYYDDHKKNRKHYIELVDGSNVNYTDLLIRGNINETIIDYVSLDIDVIETLKALMLLPMDTHKFAVITFEHDCYIHGPYYKNKSREYLINRGYELIVTNLKHSITHGDFEDWWVHPDLVDKTIIDNIKSADDSIKEWTSYLFKN